MASDQGSNQKCHFYKLGALGSEPGLWVHLSHHVPSRHIESPRSEGVGLVVCSGSWIRPTGTYRVYDRRPDRLGEWTCFSACCLKVPLAQGMRSENPPQKTESVQDRGSESRKGRRGSKGTAITILFFSSNREFPLKHHSSACSKT